MNVENILKVADAIEQHSIPNLGFNMLDWHDQSGFNDDMSGHNCGTTACIAGWACAVKGKGVINEKVHIESDARDFFGLDYETSSTLFVGSPAELALSEVTPAKAVRILRHLAATGEVNWDLPEPTAA